MNKMSKLVAALAAAITIGAGLASADLPVTNNVALWLRADAGITTVGPTNVSVWADQSGNARHATQATDAFRPQLVANSLNGLPTLNFDGPNDVFALTPTPQSTNATIFLVYRVDPTTPSNYSPHLVGRDAGAALYNGVAGANQTLRPSIYWGGIGIQYSVDAPGWNDVRFGTSASSLQIDVNGGGLQTAATSPTPLGNWNSIGTAAQGIQQDFKGGIAELIMYNRVLNTAERQIVQNNLSAKYALPMAANDRYAGDDGAQGNYDTDVFGVGRVDAGNQLLSGTVNTGLALSTGSLSDNQFVLGGHKVAVNGFTDQDTDSGSRMERVWYLDATGSPVTDFGITFDFSEAGVGAPPAGSFQLLYASNNSFEGSESPFTVLSSSYSVVGDEVTFTVNGSQLLDGYYTFAAVPEPSTVLLIGVGGLLLLRRGRVQWQQSPKPSVH